MKDRIQIAEARAAKKRKNSMECSSSQDGSSQDGSQDDSQGWNFLTYIFKCILDI